MFGTIPIHDSIVSNKFGQGQAVLLRSETDLPKILREHLQPDFRAGKARRSRPAPAPARG